MLVNGWYSHSSTSVVLFKSPGFGMRHRFLFLALPTLIAGLLTLRISSEII